MEPGAVHRYDIDCGATALAVKAGERLQLEVSSSNFPKDDRNPNTGEDPFTASAFVSVTQTVYHSPEYPTLIVVPVLRAADGEKEELLPNKPTVRRVP